MVRIAQVAALALPMLATGGARAEPETAAVPVLVCEVSGYDVIIHNRGDGAIAAGADMAWSVPFARRQGRHMLATALPPGDPIVLSGVLGSSFLSADRACAVTID